MFGTVVIDNFLDIETQRYIHDKIINECEFKFLKDVSGQEDQTFPSYGFVHVLKDPRNGHISDLYDKISIPIIEQLKIIGLQFEEVYYNRIFFQVPLASSFNKPHNGIHVDLDPSTHPHIAAVYYVNGSDGDTIIYEQCHGEDTSELKEHMRVRPKRGSLVLFDGSRYHCSSQPTINYRCIINFDLLKVKDETSS
jgi:hypothetical protein